MSIERNERESLILARLAREGSLSVAALSRQLGVSEVTVRSDLRTLEERGMLARTHGGAEATGYRNVLERQLQHAGEKGRIAAAAAELIRDDDVVMIEAGTTCAEIVAHLGERRGVRILTNSTLVLRYARLHPSLTVVLTGGTFHRSSESLVGPGALASIEDFNVRLAFFGTDGFSAERGLTTAFAEGAEVIRAMKARATESWLVADASKYARAGFVSVMPLADLAGVISDSGLGEDARTELGNSGVEVRIV
ncbi:MAG: DeoR/GlpR family DNA-binding transcription regulator [Propionicimonas sp.]|uniref:DeoR/GlpR family DNA-binding transcription regulator n=1 Tax=Propionicimonas sp. TaxID=1955623 RepID=UPI003D0FEBCB